MAAGRPIVATDVGGVPDAVRHEDNGLLVPPQNPHALAAGIESLLSDPARARLMGSRGLARARTEFTAAVIIRSLERSYEELLSRSGR
jgi:glycosyltransferase involved in cell wall biosynthesis